MKESFEKKLHQFRDVIETPKIESNELDTEKLKAVKEWAIAQAVEKTKTPIETQRRIFNIQQRKQEMMQDLKKEFRMLDAGDYENLYSEGSSVYIENEHLFVGEDETTLGKILVDLDWDIPHRLDSSIPREIHKKYLVERAKAKIHSELNEQIILEETHSVTLDGGIKYGYKSLSREHTKDKIQEIGHTAEKIVKGFIKRISIDMPDSKFEVVEADAEHDVNRKIDFILVRKRHHRGVGVEAQDIQGVQFTTGRGGKFRNHKLKQIEQSKNQDHSDDLEHINDIILVRASSKSILGAYKLWEKEKKSGGPDLDPQILDHLITNLFKGFIDDDSINRIKQFSVHKPKKENIEEMMAA